MKSNLLVSAAIFATIGLTFAPNIRSAPAEKGPGPWSDPADLSLWPNRTSRANGDAWLVQNHDRLRQMRPRLLVVNFSNEHSRSHLDGLINAIIRSLAESSRYHGYSDPRSPVFLRSRRTAWVPGSFTGGKICPD